MKLKNNIFNKRIPTILGIIILIGGLVTGIVLVSKPAHLLTRAGPSSLPKNVEITNLGENKVTISWTTDIPVSGIVKYSENPNKLLSIGRDIRDQNSSEIGIYTTHFVNLTNLQANHTYYLEIMSGSETYNNVGKPYQLKTKTEAKGMAEDIIKGKILSSVGQGLKGVIVYINISGGETLSALTIDNGFWQLNLGEVRNKNGQFLVYDKQNQQLSIFVQGGTVGTAIALTDTAHDTPVEDIVIGSNVNFVENIETGSKNTHTTDHTSLDNNGFSEIIAGDNSEAIINPQIDGEKIATSSPEFRGKLPVGVQVKITVHSQLEQSATIDVSDDGFWTWTPPENLEAGEHYITIEYKDQKGVWQKVVRSFTVLANEEADLDVYFAAFVIPDTLFQLLILGAISATFIPIYQEYIQKKSLKEANEMANTTLTSLGSIQILLTLILIIYAKPIVSLVTHYPAHQLNLMVSLIRIMFVAQLLFTVSAFLTSILQAQRRFLIPAIAPVFYNLGTISGIFFLSSRYGIYSAAYGVAFGAFLHLLIQIPLAKKLGFSAKIIFNFHHNGTRSIFKLMPPRTLALGLSQLERWVAVNLTSLLTAGSLAIFSFARQLYILPITLFGVSLGQASFPLLSTYANTNNKSQFVYILSQSTLQIFFFALPASILILVLRVPLIRLVFGVSSFPWQATLLTAKALAVLSLSIAPQATNHLLTRAFHAKKNTRTPLKVSLITITFFIVSAYISTQKYNLGVIGITSSLSASNLLNFLILFVLIQKKIARLDVVYPILKMILVSFLTALSLWFPMRLLDQFVFDTTRTAPLIILTIIVSLIGFAVYFFFSWILKIDQLQEVVRLSKKIGNWRRPLTQTDEVIETSLSDQG